MLNLWLKRTGRSRYQCFAFFMLSCKLKFEQILHDEIHTYSLELNQVEERNQTLAKDNAKLLQRWLDAKQVEANRMNEANDFYENMRSRHENVLSWRDGSGVEPAASNQDSGDTQITTLSGKDLANPDSSVATMKNGALFPASQGLSLTPNG